MRLVFTSERETKNTVRFKEEAADGEEKVGTLYVRKDTVAELGAPTRLVVTIDSAAA